MITRILSGPSLKTNQLNPIVRLALILMHRSKPIIPDTQHFNISCLAKMFHQFCTIHMRECQILDTLSLLYISYTPDTPQLHRILYTPNISATITRPKRAHVPILPCCYNINTAPVNHRHVLHTEMTQTRRIRRPERGRKRLKCNLIHVPKTQGLPSTTAPNSSLHFTVMMQRHLINNNSPINVLTITVTDQAITSGAILHIRIRRPYMFRTLTIT
jgi:hypothetical protein